MVEFNDAQAMALAHPETFAVPSQESLNGLRKGDLVQVCGDHRERFWARIVKVDGDSIEATVSNTLVKVPLSFGDTIHFERRHVYQVAQ